jgi:hypothetical protein
VSSGCAVLDEPLTQCVALDSDHFGEEEGAIRVRFEDENKRSAQSQGHRVFITSTGTSKSLASTRTAVSDVSCSHNSRHLRDATIKTTLQRCDSNVHGKLVVEPSYLEGTPSELMPARIVEIVNARRDALDDLGLIRYWIKLSHKQFWSQRSDVLHSSACLRLKSALEGLESSSKPSKLDNNNNQHH